MPTADQLHRMEMCLAHDGSPDLLEAFRELRADCERWFNLVAIFAWSERQLLGLNIAHGFQGYGPFVEEPTEALKAQLGIDPEELRAKVDYIDALVREERNDG